MKDEGQELFYRQLPLNIRCSASNDCNCSFCQGCHFVIDTVNHLLSIAVENDMKTHYVMLASNLDGLFEAAAEKLGEDRYIQ